MHPSVYAFASTALYPGQVAGKRVVEAGAYDYNGTVRPAIEAHGPASYTGTDAQPGPGVDVVCPAEKLPAELGEGTADVVISTEMLEHAADWQDALAGMATVLADGGFLVLTTRSRGFPYHPHPEDHWRFSRELMDAALDACGLQVLRLEDDPAPTYGVMVVARKPPLWIGIDTSALRALTAGSATSGTGWFG